MRPSFAIAAAFALTAASASVAQERSALESAVSAKTRSPSNVARDTYRHPAQTLSFFGVKPTDTAVDIWPGGGWYTETLAPYVTRRGTLYAAVPMPNGARGVEALKAKDAATYGPVRIAGFPASDAVKVPDGSADVVLTFRNVHNWRFDGTDQAQARFAEMYRMLKPGGTLGVVEHRLPAARDASAEQKSGYMNESSVIAFARAAGFELVQRSEINANPRDTAGWPEGVWTLPPSYRLKDVDRARYAAIGESDRMTLKFRKPR